jgi:Domain of unknown function (DUF4397)
MNRLLPFLGALFLVSACSSGGNTDGGSTTGGGTTGATSTGGTTTGVAIPPVRLRVADLSPNTTPFDFCLALTGTQNYIGPIMSGRSSYGGLTYPSVSDYTSLPPGTYDLVFVAPGMLDCTLPQSGAGYTPLTTLPPLAGGTSYTVALMGPSSGLDIATFTDDTSTAAPASLRFIPATAGFAALDMSANSVATFSNVSYATIPGMTSSIDANGYASLNYSGTYELSFSVQGSNSPVLIASGITFTGGSYSSVFTIPPPTGHSGTLSAFVCFDSQQPVLGLASCFTFP